MFSRFKIRFVGVRIVSPSESSDKLNSSVGAKLSPPGEVASDPVYRNVARVRFWGDVFAWVYVVCKLNKQNILFIKKYEPFQIEEKLPFSEFRSPAHPHRNHSRRAPCRQGPPRDSTEIATMPDGVKTKLCCV